MMIKHLTPAHYEIAEQNGINSKLAYNRFYVYGWELEEAINLPKGTIRNKDVWTNWKDIAEQNGVTRGAFFRRKGRGMSAEKAATTPLRPKSSIPRWVFDKAKENGIKPNVLCHRINTYKWTYEDACTYPVGKRGTRVKGRKITNETFSH